MNESVTGQQILAAAEVVEKLRGLRAASEFYNLLTQNRDVLNIKPLPNEWALLPAAVPWAMAEFSGRPFADCVSEFHNARPPAGKVHLIDDSFQIEPAVRESMLMNLSLSCGKEITAILAQALTYHDQCLARIASGEVKRWWKPQIEASRSWLQKKLADYRAGEP